MKRLFVVTLLLAIMLGLRALKAESAGANDPLTLAAIGFVVLAAFSVSEAGAKLSLPRVTGYILAGVALGPSVANILSSSVVQEMRMFNTLALGLIATSAGLELDLAALKKLWRTLAYTIGIKVVLGCTLVAGVLIAMERAFGLLMLPDPAQILPIALVFGALSLGTSPAISLAVINDMKAKGRLAELILGAAVAKDVVVVVALALAVAAAHAVSAGAGGLDGSVLVDVGVELVTSIGAGAVLGLILIIYLRFVHAEMLLFVAAMVLVVAELTRVLHLELLLVFIVAGFIVRNFSKHEEELLHPLEMVALPVFVVFFTIAGASIDLSATYQLLPVALALFAVRAIVFYVASQGGGKLAGEAPEIRRLAWLGYLPQAGVTLGLVGVAASQLTDVAQPIGSLGMAVVAVNLLIGPVTLRVALSKFRALDPSADPAAVADELDVPSTPHSAAGPASASAPLSEVGRLVTEGEVERALADLEHAAIRREIAELHTSCRALATAFVGSDIRPWVSSLRREVEEMFAPEDVDVSETLRAFATRHPVDVESVQGARCHALMIALRDATHCPPAEHIVPLEQVHREIGPNDSGRLRWHKRRMSLKRFLSGGKRGGRRVVPTRLLARVALEPRTTSLSIWLLATWVRAELAMLTDLIAIADGRLELVQGRDSIIERLDDFEKRAAQELQSQIDRGTLELIAKAKVVDTPALELASIRFSSVEAELSGMRERLEEEPASWQVVVAGELVRLAAVVALSEVDDARRSGHESHIHRPTADARNALTAAFETAIKHLESVASAVAAEGGSSKQKLEALEETLHSELEDNVSAAIENAATDFRVAVSVHSAAQEVRDAIARLPEVLSVLDSKTSVERLRDPKDAVPRNVRLRDVADEELVRIPLPATEQLVRNAASAIHAAGQSVREAVAVARHALAAHGDLQAPTTRDVVALEQALARAVERARNAGVDAIEKLASCHSETESRLDEAIIRVRSLALHGETGSRRAELEHALSRLSRRLVEWVNPVRTFGREVVRRVREVATGDVSRDLARLARANYDAADIRDALRVHLEPPNVPADYARLFSLAPVLERRHFIARQAELETVLSAERAWMGGDPGSVLVVGPRGSGRTSILNVAEFELRAPRVIRPEVHQSVSGRGLIDELAGELGCKRSIEAVRRALLRKRTAILVDDLEEWFDPTLNGMRLAEGFVELLAMTRGTTFWLISMDEGALSVIEEALPIRQAFARTVALSRVDSATISEVIEGRHRLSGRAVHYSSTWLNRLLSRFKPGSARAIFFSLLNTASDGNLAKAVSLWARAVHVDDADTVVAQIGKLLPLRLPFLSRLEPIELALVVSLSRWGSSSLSELTELVGAPRSDVRQHLSFLVASGLMTSVGRDMDQVTLHPNMRAAVSEALGSLGAR